MYSNQSMSPEEFLRSTYKLILMKMDIIINIQKQPEQDIQLLKKKYKETGKILKVITELIKTIDYESKHGPELASILNDAGLILSQANISDKPDALVKYDIVKAIFESFLL